MSHASRVLRVAAVVGAVVGVAVVTGPTAHSAPTNPVPLNIAHRGYSARYPENTTRAFTEAKLAGAQAVEFDVDFSKSNVSFAMHDWTLDRTTTGTGRNRSRWWSYIAAQRVDITPPYRDPVPTMFQSLKAIVRTSGLPAIVEVKGTLSPTQVANFADRVRWFGYDHVLVESFSVQDLLLLRARDPGIRTALLSATCPEPTTVALAGSTYALVNHLNITADCVSRLHAAGMSIQAWTADTAADWVRLRDLGVDGVMTNDPAGYAAWARSVS